jgi:hypothetical protein
MGYIVMVIEVLIVAVIMLAASGVQAQDTEPILGCLGEVDTSWTIIICSNCEETG